MSLLLLCKSIDARVVKELASAKSPDEKALILTSALYGYGRGHGPEKLACVLFGGGRRLTPVQAGPDCRFGTPHFSRPTFYELLLDLKCI